jgi:hypothetical protein
MSNDISRKPLGYSVVVELPTGELTVGHVKIQPEYIQDRVNWQVALSGDWLVQANDVDLLRNLLTDHVLVVFDDEEPNISSELLQGVEVQSVATLQETCLAEYHRMHDAWTEYVAEQPAKRKKLVAPNEPRLPEVAAHSSAVLMLQESGKPAFVTETPGEFRELIARCRVVRMLAEAWLSVETDRTIRKFLHLDPRVIRPTPFH